MKPLLLLRLTGLIFTIALQSGLAQNGADAPAVLSMPEDRAAGSYTIYSRLLPFGEAAGKTWLRSDRDIAPVIYGRRVARVNALERSVNEMWVPLDKREGVVKRHLSLGGA